MNVTETEPGRREPYSMKQLPKAFAPLRRRLRTRPLWRGSGGRGTAERYPNSANSPRRTNPQLRHGILQRGTPRTASRRTKLLERNPGCPQAAVRRSSASPGDDDDPGGAGAGRPGARLARSGRCSRHLYVRLNHHPSGRPGDSGHRLRHRWPIAPTAVQTTMRDATSHGPAGGHVGAIRPSGSCDMVNRMQMAGAPTLAAAWLGLAGNGYRSFPCPRLAKLRLSCTRFPWTPICPGRDRNDDAEHERDRSS
jgi:hypothetical protein